MAKKLEIIGAQGIWPTPNETTDQPYDKITRSHLINNFSDFNLIKNFQFVCEKIGPYLKQIAQSPSFQKKAALAVAQEDANFGVNLTAEPQLSLEERVRKTQKMTGPKLTMRKQ